jgi:hypothetical protein
MLAYDSCYRLFFSSCFKKGVKKLLSMLQFFPANYSQFLIFSRINQEYSKKEKGVEGEMISSLMRCFWLSRCPVELFELFGLMSELVFSVLPCRFEPELGI